MSGRRPYLSQSVMVGLYELWRRTAREIAEDPTAASEAELAAIVWIFEMRRWRSSRKHVSSAHPSAHDAPSSLQGPGGSATIPPEETSETA